jgi:hypothetical protein
VHVAATFDGATMRLYVDGTPRLSQGSTGRPVPSDQPLYVGTNKNNTLNDQVFDGRLDDVRLYAEVLSASAIAALVSPLSYGACGPTSAGVRGPGSEGAS